MLHLYLCLGLSLAGQIPNCAGTWLARQFPDSPGIVVLGVTDHTIVNARSLGELSFTNPGYDEENTLARLQSYALNHGANLVQVTVNRPPGRRSYGLVSARIYKVADVRLYEPWIDWSADRRLLLSDFKGPPAPQNRSHSNCAFYMLPKIHDVGHWIFTRTRFYTRSSSIDRSALNQGDLLLHEQGEFDLCELYRRKLDTALNLSPEYPYNREHRESTYKQIYAAYLHTRQQYDSATRNGFDHAQQTRWAQRIAAADFPFIPILTLRQLDKQARALPPSDRLALVYVIRPDQYNSPFWKRIIIDPYCVWPCILLFFFNPSDYSVNCDSTTQGPVGARRFVYHYARPGSCRVNSSNGDSTLTLHLDPGKVYYVKMKLMERRFFAGAHPEWELLSDEQGRSWLRKCRLSTNWQPPGLPVYPDPLR
jgi:hypothetical protein